MHEGSPLNPRMKQIFVIVFLGSVIGAVVWQWVVDAPEQRKFDEEDQKRQMNSVPRNAAEIAQGWNVTWGGIEREECGAVAYAPDNTVYLSGMTCSYGVGNGDMLLVKYALDGTQLWNRTM